MMHRVVRGKWKQMQCTKAKPGRRPYAYMSSLIGIVQSALTHPGGDTERERLHSAVALILAE